MSRTDLATAPTLALDATSDLAREALVDFAHTVLTDNAYAHASKDTERVTVWDAVCGAYVAVRAALGEVGPTLSLDAMLGDPREHKRLFVVVGPALVNMPGHTIWAPVAAVLPTLDATRAYLDRVADGRARQVYEWNQDDPFAGEGRDGGPVGWDEVRELAKIAVKNGAAALVYDDLMRPRPASPHVRIDTIGDVLARLDRQGRDEPDVCCDLDGTEVGQYGPIEREGVAKFMRNSMMYAHETVCDEAQDGDYVSVENVLGALLTFMEEYLCLERELESHEFVAPPALGDECFIVRNLPTPGREGEVRVVRTEKEARKLIAAGGVEKVTSGSVVREVGSWKDAVSAVAASDDAPLYVNLFAELDA